MEQYALYLLLKKLINELGYNFKISFNDYNINGDNIIGIIFKSGNNPDYRELATGKYAGYTNRVQILVQSGLSKDSLMSAMSLTYLIRNILTESINNNIYKIDSLEWLDERIKEIKNNTQTGEDVYVGITKTHLIGDVDFKGKSSQSRSIYSLNMLIDYFIKIGG